MFNVQAETPIINFEMMELKSHAGAVLNKLMYVRKLKKLDSYSWDYTDDEYFIHHLIPVLTYLEQDISDVHNAINKLFLDNNHKVLNLPLVDHMIHMIDTRILQLV